ncbi:hypothetical protein PENSPDRAFT_751634 [Peniophora sp. CONT]|nr:hypothetical protein PENSPDRAFT_751634 [Peniophora sp. CONT]
MPIEKLDLDVLLIIFEICVDLDPPCREHGLGFIRLSHVNRRWRNLALALSPALWGRIISYSWCQAMFDTILSRSRDASLILDMYLCNDVHVKQFMPTKEIERLLVPRAHTIILDDYDDLTLTGRTLTLLQTLRRYCGRVFDRHDPIVAPSLRRLSVSDFLWSINAPSLRILEVDVACVTSDLIEDLEVADAWLTALPTFLPAHPCLEEVTINAHAESDINGYDWDDLAPRIRSGMEALERGLPAVQMRCLRTLKVSAHALFLAFMWRSLAVPPTATVQLRILEGLHDHMIDVLKAIHTYPSDPTYNMLTISHSLTKNPRHQETNIIMSGADVGTATGSCTLRCPQDRTHFAFQSALDQFSVSVGKHLRTLCLQIYVDIHDITRGAGTYASIESLEFRGRASTLAQILSSYQFPRLRTMVVDVGQKYDPEEMRSLARELRMRRTKLQHLVLRGKTNFREETRLDGDVRVLRLHKAALTVVDERTGLFKRAPQPISKKQDARRTSGAAGTARTTSGGMGRARVSLTTTTPQVSRVMSARPPWR